LIKVLKCQDGEVTIEELSDCRKKISVKPFIESRFVEEYACETTYSIELIEKN
jgi:hypothetical protein